MIILCQKMAFNLTVFFCLVVSLPSIGFAATNASESINQMIRGGTVTKEDVRKTFPIFFRGEVHAYDSEVGAGILA